MPPRLESSQATGLDFRRRPEPEIYQVSLVSGIGEERRAAMTKISGTVQKTTVSHVIFSVAHDSSLLEQGVPYYPIP